MVVGRWDFRPTVIPTLVTMLLLTLLLQLGFWQLGKSGTKAGMQDRQSAARSTAPIQPAAIEGDPEDLRYTLVTGEGRFLVERQFLLDNRTHQGKAGYHVITPFQPADGSPVLLVNRGWVPVGADRAILPDITVDGSRRIIAGALTVAVADAFLLGDAGYAQETWPRVVQRLEPASIAKLLKTPVHAPILRLDEQMPDGFIRQWPAHWGITPERHQGYAIQWFSLAAALAVIYVVVNTREVDVRNPEDTES